MSYLDLPRLHFFGTFLANPSTLDNTPANYNLQPPLVPLWNPDGSHAWQFPSCAVQTVVGPSGTGTGDPLVGTPVASTDSPSTAKLVDLDTEQQMVSTIFGLQVQVGSAASGTFVGTFQPVPFMDIFMRILGIGPDTVFSAYYQSVLESVQWSPSPASPILQALQKVSPNTLSIKFVVDDFQDDSSSPNFTLGRVAGTIGPYFPGEPINFVAGRLLRPQTILSGPAGPGDQGNSSLPINYAPAKVDSQRSVAIFDFGNTFPAVYPGANAPATPPLPFANPQPADLGTLQAALLAPRGALVLGTIDNTGAAYQATAGIQEFPLTADQLTQVQGGNASGSLPAALLAVVQQAAGQLQPVLLVEDGNATTLSVTPIVCRLNPGESVEISLVATSFSAPAANQTIYLQINNSLLQPGGGFPVGVPAGVLQLPASVTTDANGNASFTVTASPQGPGNPRGPIDGQVYGIGFSWQLDGNPDPNVVVSVHVYDQVAVPAQPTWWQDVEPILRPYNDLFPFMSRMINLDRYQAVKSNAQEIATRMQYPLTDPRYMPVTRDISDAKKQIVLTWIANGMPEGTKPA